MKLSEQLREQIAELKKSDQRLMQLIQEYSTEATQRLKELEQSIRDWHTRPQAGPFFLPVHNKNN